jgi:oxygen-dependent protoporphyrinogen oxidase
MPAVAIIGSGIAGLTGAFVLHRHGLEVTVFEANARTGGMIGSHRIDGYLVEQGPNALQRTTPALQRVINELGLDAAKLPAHPAANRRYVVHGGRPVALPSSPASFITSRLFSLRAKLRLLCEPFIPATDPEAEESVAAFVRRRLGPELLDYAVNPFVAGIYAGDPERLSLRHAFPRLHALEQEHGSLIRGMLRRLRSGQGQASPMPREPLFSVRDGLQTLPDALREALGDHVRLKAPVVALAPSANGWHVTTQAGNQTHTAPFDAVLYAAPLHRLGDLKLKTSPPAAPLTRVQYPPVSVLALGFRREDVGHPLDGFGLLVPAVETDFRILGTLFSSSIFPDRAPHGHVLLTTFVGGTRDPQVGLAPTPVLLETVLRDLERLLDVRTRPAFVHHVAWDHAIPQYQLGYGRVKAHIETLERQHPRFAMAGNYRQGISVGEAASSGEAAARRLLDSLRQPRT